MSDFQSALQTFTGTEQYHRHPMYREPVYTDGMRYFFQNAGQGAYWLLDILATEPAIRKQAQEFASIKLAVKDSGAMLAVNDGDDSANVFERRINYTDCPEGTYQFYWVSGVLMLSREY
ncbi:DUF6876 family protein [Acidovorax sp.]|uniref:DUF6876 family protein n=1 Tax=Acidovorax sp. TaxID=1872122 RepID=UPI00391F51B2